MQKYIGVKAVEAKPMTRKEYNDYRGWTLPEDENGDDPGFLKNDGNGHIQWDPKDAFNRDFRQFDAMTFGHAIEALKAGKRVARQGWNGKGMFIYLTEGTEISKDMLRGACAEAVKYIDSKMSLASLPSQHTQRICSHIDMKAADGSLVIGWLASQTDMLSEDWQIVE